MLARKYRPRTFEDLIGQEAMVRTIANSFALGRIPHAYMLTGVRGVGKTTTARLIARALNYETDTVHAPSIKLDPQNDGTLGVHCEAIMESRHPDVFEMDAASRTGINDIREILDSVRYAPVSARTKVYIIDEVHMLSTQAFNGLLKTLEEPPPHVKFIFATTEIRKVPVTVLSRCQRFDLRRIPAEMLTTHFAMVAEKEGVEVEPEALALIARAAEGSARDGLSILDQAIAHGAGAVTAQQVREMIGLSDRGAIRALLGLLLAGDAQGALVALKEQYDLGVEPSAVIRGLLECVHGITRAKVGGALDPAQSVEEREAYADWASRLSHAAIHRLWQLLLKGLGEVLQAGMPLEAAEMALLRAIHASELPDPGALIEQLASGEAAVRRPGAAGQGGQQGESSRAPASFPALIEQLAANGKQHVAQQLHDFVGLVRYAPPELVIRPSQPLAGDFMRDLAAALKGLTGTPWQVTASDSEAQPSLRDQEKAEVERLRQDVLDSPMVKAAFEAFPDAELTGYTNDEQRSA